MADVEVAIIKHSIHNAFDGRDENGVAKFSTTKTVKLQGIKTTTGETWVDLYLEVTPKSPLFDLLKESGKYKLTIQEVSS